MSHTYHLKPTPSSASPPKPATAVAAAVEVKPPRPQGRTSLPHHSETQTENFTAHLESEADKVAQRRQRLIELQKERQAKAASLEEDRAADKMLDKEGNQLPESLAASAAETARLLEAGDAQLRRWECEARLERAMVELMAAGEERDGTSRAWGELKMRQG